MAQENESKGLSKKIKNIKPAQWAMVVLSLTAGYFVYQDYAERQAEREYCEAARGVIGEANKGNIRIAPEVNAQLVRSCAKYWAGGR